MPEPFFVGARDIDDPSKPPLISIIDPAGLVWDFTAKAFVPGDSAGADLFRPMVAVRGAAHRGIGRFSTQDLPESPYSGAYAVQQHDPDTRAPIGGPVPVQVPSEDPVALAVSFSRR